MTDKHWSDEASFTDLIISYLLSCKSIRMQRKILYQLVQKRRKLNQQTFNSNLFRLSKKGVIVFDKNNSILIKKDNLKSYGVLSKIKERPTGDKTILVLFDIPEKKRKIRHWLRNQLKDWDFKMIQQSVWVGSGSLPKEFNKRLQLLDIDKGVKIFKIQKNK